MARNSSPLPRNTVAKNWSSCIPIRSRSTPINHRKLIPAKGNRSRAISMDFELSASHLPGSSGLSGIESRRSVTLMMSRIENKIPAIAPARGAFSWAEIAVFLSSSMIPPNAGHRVDA